MEEKPLSRAYLESLTNDELIKTADSFGMDIQDDTDRVLIIEELLEFSSSDLIDNSSDNQEKAEFSKWNLVESAPLPSQYNITFIDVIIRDPLWAFVFWEIKAQDKEQFEKTQDFSGYYLKVSPASGPAKLPPASFSGKKADKIFSVLVNPNDTAWYLGLNPGAAEELSFHEQIQYKIELCAGLGDGEMVLAVSNPVRLPGLPEMPIGAGKQGDPASCFGENPLVRLSGYGDFHIIRRNERPPRPKRGESASS